MNRSKPEPIIIPDDIFELLRQAHPNCDEPDCWINEALASGDPVAAFMAWKDCK